MLAVSFSKLKGNKNHPITKFKYEINSWFHFPYLVVAHVDISLCMGVWDEEQQSDSETSGVNMGESQSGLCGLVCPPSLYSDQVLWFAVLGRNYCAF